MSGKRQFGLVIAAMIVAAATTGTAIAADVDAKKVQYGEAETKKLLLLMDKDQNGKVSRDEFMTFMQAEFDRLDVNKDGELDVEELTKLRLHGFGGLHK